MTVPKKPKTFQAVGMKCRETLIQFVKALGKSEMVPEGDEAPKRADVVGWSSLIASAVAGGEHNAYIRAHLKTISKSAWELANWLTHTNGATRPDAEVVLDATQTVIHIRNCRNALRKRQPRTMPRMRVIFH